MSKNKCVMKDCKRKVVHEAPTYLCKKHWDDWINFKLVVVGRRNAAYAYYRKAKNINEIN